MMASYPEGEEGVDIKFFMQRLCRSFAMLFERKTLRPMLLIWVYFLLQSWTGQIGLRPYVIQVCNELNMPINPYWITVSQIFFMNLKIIIVILIKPTTAKYFPGYHGCDECCWLSSVSVASKEDRKQIHCSDISGHWRYLLHLTWSVCIW